jgi:hypothetical protein
MATSTLVQFLGDGITSPSGTEADTSNRRQVETFISGGAIAAGDWVSLDVSKTGADKALYVIEAPATASDARCIGVALAAAAAAGEQVRVVVAGYVAEANVATGTGIGQALTPNGTAGRVGPAEYIGNGSGAAAVRIPTVCGVTLTLAAANKAEVMVKKQF